MTIPTGSADEPDQNIPSILVTTPAWSRRFKLNRDTITVGRDIVNDIVIDDAAVSNDHALITRTPRGFKLEDLSSLTGISFQSQRIIKKFLSPGDQLWIGDSISLTYGETYKYESEIKSRKLDIGGRQELTIGRSIENDIVLDHPTVSRVHARIDLHPDEGKYWIQDLRTGNGTFVNGERIVKPRALRRGDVINIGSIRFDFYEQQLNELDEGYNIRLDAIHLEQRVSSELNLIRDISLTVMPGEFVAIVGGSGTGKSTLIGALNGSKPATAGQVLVNGRDLYRNFDIYKSQIGYVPQENIIHKELTVYEALNYSAILRLPRDTGREERHRRIEEVIRTLNLADKKDVIVSNLSGGQKKRISIGVELLTKPGLFFLDEATSGLDPGMESSMMEVLRKLADHGHTVVLITHATRNISLCDQVAFLAYGGYLAYYGSPNNALKFFNVNDFDDIYSKLELSPSDNRQAGVELDRDKVSAEWAARYNGSDQFEEYVAGRQPKYPTIDSGRLNIKKSPVTTWMGKRHTSDITQCTTLLRRSVNILVRDKVTLLLMLLIAPVVGLLCAPFWRQGIFNVTGGDAELAITNLFIASIVCCITGAISSMREIVKETDIYHRERMVILKITPYILSKTIIFLILSMYQAGVFLLILKLFGNWPDSAIITWQVYIILFLATMAGAMQGLLISAISPNQNAAPQLLIILIVLQLVFGGIVPPRDLPVVKAMNNILGTATSTRWTFESMVTTSELGADIAEDPYWQKTKIERNQIDDSFKVANCNCAGINVFSKCNFPGIMEYYAPAVDAAEPAKPSKPIQPADPPGKPIEPRKRDLADPKYYQDIEKYQDELQEWGIQMEDYSREVSTYEDQMKDYEIHVDSYTENYKDWRTSRESAVGKAEGLINTINENYGHTFKVNITLHRMALVFFIVIVFSLLLVIQKLKDRRYSR